MKLPVKLISITQIAFIFCILCCHGIKGVDSGLCVQKELEPTSKELITALDNKLASFTTILSNVDSNLKLLNEKSQVWDLFRHHVNSWNDQIKALDHKIDLIKRTQEESKIVETKLTSLEFTLNHILSKVVYLSDNRYDCGCCKGPSGPSSPVTSVTPPSTDQHNKIINLEKEIKREITTRLSNILRHVLNIENGNCRLNRNVSVTVGPKNKVQVDSLDSGISLRGLYEKFDNFTNHFSQKDFKQFTAIGKKNSKTLDEIIGSIRKLDQRAASILDMQKEQKLSSSNYRQSLSGEIMTFASSSNILLKKIEKIALNMQSKLAEDEENEMNDSTMSSTTVAGYDDIEGLESMEIDFREVDVSGCHEVTTKIDGIYKFSDREELDEAGRDFNKRFCVFPKEGFGYTVIQNRGPYGQQENFNRSWLDYRNGFGDLNEEFWFGNEFVHQLTQQDSYELRIEMEDFDGVKVWAEYTTFQIESEIQNYTLIIGGYKGAVNDAMLYHHGQQFSTFDRRNDKTTDPCCPCSPGFGSGWWFNSCSQANLNGIYRNSPKGHNNIGITWQNWHPDYSLKRTRMLIRPKQDWSGEVDDDVEIFLKK